MSLGDESEEKTREVKSYPLNSKRLSAQVVRRIAVALGLPKASLADTRQMVEGSLSEDREPRNVQVDLVGSESGTIIRLRDTDGVFLDIMPPDDPDEEEGSAGSRRGTGDQEVGEETEMETEMEAEVIEDDLRPRTGGVRDETEAEEELQRALDAAQERIARLETRLRRPPTQSQTVWRIRLPLTQQTRLRRPPTQSQTVWRIRLPLTQQTRLRRPPTQSQTVWRIRLPFTQQTRLRRPPTQSQTVWRIRLPLTQQTRLRRPPTQSQTVWRIRLPRTRQKRLRRPPT